MVGGRIVALPPGLLPSHTPVAQIDGGLIEESFVSRPILIRNAGGNQRAATPHALSVERCFLVGDASLRQCPDYATRGSAGSRTQSGRRQPSSGDDRTQTRNRQQTKAREQTGGTAEARTNAHSRCRTFGTIVDPVAVTIDFLVRAVPVDDQIIVKVLRDEFSLRGIRSLTAEKSEEIEQTTDLELELAARDFVATSRLVRSAQSRPLVARIAMSRLRSSITAKPSG
ncbi:hypothetical protein WN73_18205 [Bradyrhizobium sp. CCBAU 45394]|nr:hypothetical protein [Bradyrhizobium sp. CCBAU 45394]